MCGKLYVQTLVCRTNLVSGLRLTDRIAKNFLYDFLRPID